MNKDLKKAKILLHKITIRKAVQNNDAELLDLIADIIYEHEEAKQILRKKGYGWMGLGIVETAELVPDKI